MKIKVTLDLSEETLEHLRESLYQYFDKFLGYDCTGELGQVSAKTYDALKDVKNGDVVKIEDYDEDYDWGDA